MVSLHRCGPYSLFWKRYILHSQLSSMMCRCILLLLSHVTREVVLDIFLRDVVLGEVLLLRQQLLPADHLGLGHGVRQLRARRLRHQQR